MSEHDADGPRAAGDGSDERVGGRADLLAEERTAGSADPEAQARAILADSEERTLDRGAAPDAVTEHRRSEDTVEPG